MASFAAALALVLALLLVTAIHESGHWLAVRAKGGRVLRIQVGRGPALWRRRGRTGDWVLSAIPIGGRIHYDRVPSGTGEAVVATGGVGANLLAAFALFALAGPTTDAVATAGAWFWAVPGAAVELVTTGSALELRGALRRLATQVMGAPVRSLPYLVGALSALWAALNLIPIPVIETDGWHMARALWKGVRGA